MLILFELSSNCGFFLIIIIIKKNNNNNTDEVLTHDQKKTAIYNYFGQ